MDDRIRARYWIETAFPLEQAAASMAGEQSTGTFTRVPGETEELRERHAARVESIGLGRGPLSPGRAQERRPRLPPRRSDRFVAPGEPRAFPAQPAGHRRGQPLGAEAVFRHAAARSPIAPCVSRALWRPAVRGRGDAAPLRRPRPPAYRHHHQAKRRPHPGGHREIVKANWPTAESISSKTTNCRPMARTALRSTPGGRHARPSRPAARTGKMVMYAANITGEIDDMLRRHDQVIAAGGTCVMVSIHSIGLPALVALAATRRSPSTATATAGACWDDRRPSA